MARILLGYCLVSSDTPAPHIKAEWRPVTACVVSSLTGITFSLASCLALKPLTSPWEPANGLLGAFLEKLPEVAATSPLVFAAAWSSAAIPYSRWRMLLLAGFILQIPLTQQAAGVLGKHFSLPLLACSIGCAAALPEILRAVNRRRQKQPLGSSATALSDAPFSNLLQSANKLIAFPINALVTGFATALKAASKAAAPATARTGSEGAQHTSPETAPAQESRVIHPIAELTNAGEQREEREDAVPAPRRAACTVIHCELTNHAVLVNSMHPSEFAALLNQVINAFEEMVNARGGVCDRLSGDALRAFFETPSTDSAQGQNALHCALSLKNRFGAISQACELKSGIELDVRIGVNTGEMVIARFGGGGHHFDGVAGESAEWGGRLASANLLYGSRILIGSSSHLLAGDAFETRPIDLLQREMPPEPPEAVFELLATKGALSMDAKERLKLYCEGVMLFRERRWQEAATSLRAARPRRGDDDAIDLLLHRIREQETLAEFPV